MPQPLTQPFPPGPQGRWQGGGHLLVLRWAGARVHSGTWGRMAPPWEARRGCRKPRVRAFVPSLGGQGLTRWSP